MYISVWTATPRSRRSLAEIELMTSSSLGGSETTRTIDLQANYVHLFRILTYIAAEKWGTPFTFINYSMHIFSQ
jgi:hypothetical protein